MKALPRAVLALVSLLLVGVAQATPACGTEGGVLPPIPLSADGVLPRDAEIGQILHRSRHAWPTGFDSAGCPALSGRVRLSAHPRLAPGLYASGVNGIGVRVLLHGQPLHADGDGPALAVTADAAHGELVVELVKSGPLSGGTAIAGSELPSLAFERSGDEIIQPFAGSVILRQSTCRIPDVRVDLGEASVVVLANGGGSPPRPFQLHLHDCPAGLSRVRYRLDPMAPAIDAANGVVGMDERATARDVGVQILDPAGQPVPFGRAERLADYRSEKGGDYRIPLRARIVPIAGGRVRAGRVSTVLNVVMIYD